MIFIILTFIDIEFDVKNYYIAYICSFFHAISVSFQKAFLVCVIVSFNCASPHFNKKLILIDCKIKFCQIPSVFITRLIHVSLKASMYASRRARTVFRTPSVFISIYIFMCVSWALRHVVCLYVHLTVRR